MRERQGGRDGEEVACGGELCMATKCVCVCMSGIQCWGVHSGATVAADMSVSSV